MNASACLDYEVENDYLSLLFGRVLPYRIQGLLFRGVPPYIVRISDSLSFTTGKLFFCYLKIESVIFTECSILFGVKIEL